MTVRLHTWCPECGSAAPTVRYNRPCENVYHDVVVGGPLNGTSAVTAVLCGPAPSEVRANRRVVTGLRRAYIARRGYWVEHSRRTGLERRKTNG